MAQSLRFEHSTTTASKKDRPLQLEIQNRTVWSCYLMDQLLSSGKQRPVTLYKDDMDIPLPVSDDDFIFADLNTPQPRISEVFSSRNSFPTQRPSDYHFSLILQGVDIWAELSNWVGEGGRRATHGRDDCPWKLHSPWGRINQRLQQWWMRLGSQIRYPSARPEAHLQRGNENSFAFINLIYYLCQKGRDDFRELEDSIQQYGSICSSEDSVEAVQTLVHAPSGNSSHTNDTTSSIASYVEAESVVTEPLHDDAFFSEENWDAWNWTGENSLTGHGHLMSFVADQELYMPERSENLMFGYHD
ncbi:hypothetical protein N7495_006950 [Penicillium taxi]|uniref:uncharacterized protein n=1 Tax=Penicillium taxi TaxID=168475 RepID=UPI002545A56F|nr:uncharacterized protein N7495_006950 [Penicillium taxi]KAJ5895259.1 hypothetical protein N7495_006950 [Penicillium taxi]